MPTAYERIVNPLLDYVNPIPSGLAFENMDVDQLRETAKQLRWELSAAYRADNGNTPVTDGIVAELLEVKALILAASEGV